MSRSGSNVILVQPRPRADSSISNHSAISRSSYGSSTVHQSSSSNSSPSSQSSKPRTGDYSSSSYHHQQGHVSYNAYRDPAAKGHYTNVTERNNVTVIHHQRSDKNDKNAPTPSYNHASGGGSRRQ